MTNDDLPAVFFVADAHAGRFQRLHFGLQRFELIALVSSAVTLQLSWATDQFNFAALVGAALLAMALAARGLEQATGYEADWRRSRSTAEAAKSMAWQFAVGGGAYPAALDEDKATALLAQSIAELGDTKPDGSADSGPHVTNEMLLLRRAPLEERHQAYVSRRLLDQRDWYAKTAATNKRATQIWSTTVTVLEALALVMAFALGFNWFEFDWAGVLGAAAAAGLAWHQAKQHSYIAVSYDAVVQNLEVLITRFHRQTEPEEWPVLVDHAEALFASEHALWRHQRTWS